MLSAEGFNGWADKYDVYVAESDRADTYPFAGYSRVLDRVFETVTRRPGAAVLDLGFGTAVLTSRLYESGCRVYGQDFSTRMVEIAKEKMPGAELCCGDFVKGLAEPLLGRKYDFIIATYAMHHLSDEEKISLIKKLRGLLGSEGKIVIGDISFETCGEMEACRADAGPEWDDDEIYIVAEEFKKVFPGAEFEKIGFCAGVTVI